MWLGLAAGVAAGSWALRRWMTVPPVPVWPDDGTEPEAAPARPVPEATTAASPAHDDAAAARGAENRGQAPQGRGAADEDAAPAAATGGTKGQGQAPQGRGAADEDAAPAAAAGGTKGRGQASDVGSPAPNMAPRATRRPSPQANPAAQAERLFAAATRRVAGEGHQEHPQNAVPRAGNAALEALADPGSPLSRALTAAGCDAWFAAQGDELLVRADAPCSRETARRLVARLQGKPQVRPDTAVRILQHLQSDVEHEAIRAGRAAMKALRINRLHPELVALVGSLSFRLSYGQNQWKHALETAELAGYLAAELGLDARGARRAGLLHDIGKAMTHAGEGAHAVLGAAAARRCGEKEPIANAIGAHHADEPPQTPLAYLVAAADALSGARPGARREPAHAYLQRLAALEEIARAYPGVRGVDIMQAGREVRVQLPGLQQGAPAADGEIADLARAIAQDIQERRVVPGEVRVVVTRVTRAMGVARGAGRSKQIA